MSGVSSDRRRVKMLCAVMSAWVTGDPSAFSRRSIWPSVYTAKMAARTSLTISRRSGVSASISTKVPSFRRRAPFARRLWHRLGDGSQMLPFQNRHHDPEMGKALREIAPGFTGIYIGVLTQKSEIGLVA